MATVAQVQARFPEFVDYGDPMIQLYLDDAALIMSDSSRWLDFYDVAQQYLTGHYLVAADASESGDFNALAPVKGQDVDDVQIQFAVSDVSADATDFSSTTYGKRFLHYRQMCFVGMYGV
jgi:hypothetical protein